METRGNYYDTLEITESASLEVVKAAYKALVKKYHPDSKNFPAKVCEEKMQEVNEAFRILSDCQKRKEYDSLMAKKNAAMNEKFSEEPGKCDQGEKFTYEENSETDSPNINKRKGGRLREFFKAIDYEIRQNQVIIDNAYYDGMSMLESELVYKFKCATGFKRNGYAKALEEKGLLYRDSDGKLTPTEEFKFYWR